ncbi:MAG TPA: ABC transporter permease [Ktedonobacteraceae bacterium]|nr:ABC transporter permease [Ktedonobacteraceae bacterium]
MSATQRGAIADEQQYASSQAGREHKPGQAQRVRVPIKFPVGILPWLLGLILLAGWYFGTANGRVSDLILPAPAEVFSMLGQGLSSGLFLHNTWVTVQESVIGFLLALVVALPFGYGLAKSRIFATTFQPYLAAGQAIPAIVIAPLLVLWLGYDIFTTMLVCMLVVVFPLVINTVFGVQSIDQALTDAARVEGAAGWSMLAHIEFPLALPAILAAVRTCLTLSITGALVGEFVSGGDQGLGALVLIAKNQYDMPLMFATLVVLAVLAALYYGASWLLVALSRAVY